MTVVALLSTAADPYETFARVYAEASGHHGPDSHLTAGEVAQRIVSHAQDPATRAAVDAVLVDTKRELRALREDKRRLLARVNGARETILAARKVGDPGWSSFALGCVLLSLTSARDEHQH